MIDVPVVICRVCKIPKLFSQLRKPHVKGLHKICKPCSARKSEEWSKNNPERAKKSNDNYRKRHRVKILAKHKKRYWENRESYLKAGRERFKKFPWIYKASSHKRSKTKARLFKEFSRKQSGVCAICHLHPSGDSLMLDHDHSTGEYRGLLCIQCNHALGRFGDDTALLRRAIAYLEYPPSRQRNPEILNAWIQ